MSRATRTIYPRGIGQSLAFRRAAYRGAEIPNGVEHALETGVPIVVRADSRAAELRLQVGLRAVNDDEIGTE